MGWLFRHAEPLALLQGLALFIRPPSASEFGSGISGPREVTWPGLTYHRRRATWLVIGSGVDKWPQLIQSEWSSGIWACNPEKVLFSFPWDWIWLPPEPEANKEESPGGWKRSPDGCLSTWIRPACLSRYSNLSSVLLSTLPLYFPPPRFNSLISSSV